MSTASFNPRTVIAGMFAQRTAEGNFIMQGKFNPAVQTVTSSGVATTTQGANATIAATGSYPLYVNAMMHNETDLQRHANQNSWVFHFSRLDGAMFANSSFQEMLPDGNRFWRVAVNKTTLAMPNQSYTFDTAAPTATLYTSSASLYQTATASFYPGDMARFSRPLAIGTLNTQGGVNDKIVLKIKSSARPNEFRLVYEFYTQAGGATVPATDVEFNINGVTKQIMGISIQGAVGTAISETGVLTRRRDTLYANRAQYVDRTPA